MDFPTPLAESSSNGAHRFSGRPKCRGWIRVSQLRFSQNSIGASLQDGRPLTRVEEDLHKGRCRVSALCPLNVVRFRGHWFSRDNRRLYILRKVLSPEQRICVRFGHVDDLSLAHFSTEDDGRTIRVRPARCKGFRPPRLPPPQPRIGVCQRILCKADWNAWLATRRVGRTIYQMLLLRCTPCTGGHIPSRMSTRPSPGSELATLGGRQSICQELLRATAGVSGRPSATIGNESRMGSCKRLLTSMDALEEQQGHSWARAPIARRWGDAA